MRGKRAGRCAPPLHARAVGVVTGAWSAPSGATAVETRGRLGARHAMIRVEHLTVTFGRGAGAITAARDVSFSVSAGMAFGLVGESGSGKTTVLRAIAG